MRCDTCPARMARHRSEEPLQSVRVRVISQSRFWLKIDCETAEEGTHRLLTDCRCDATFVISPAEPAASTVLHTRLNHPDFQRSDLCFFLRRKPRALVALVTRSETLAEISDRIHESKTSLRGRCVVRICLSEHRP